MGKIIQIKAITVNGEDGLRKYINDTQSKVHDSKFGRLRMRASRRLASQYTFDEYFENPLRIHITIKQEYAHLVFDMDKITSQAMKHLKDYGITEADVSIELLID